MLDDMVAQRVINAVKRGLPRGTAARLASISKATLMNWLRRGREGDPKYVDFLARVRAAEAEGEDEIVALMRVHARTSVPACIFLLERRNPEAWGKGSDAAHDAAKPPVVTSSEERMSLLESLMAAERSAAG